MVLNDKDCNMKADDFYSPICVSGYLTPLQRKKLREKRNTPLTSDFENDFKTPKSSTKNIKKPKRLSSSKFKPRVKTPKEQPLPKSSKENHSEMRYSVASLVAQGPSDGFIKERRFFKNRSPLHLQKTEFVMPLSYKKRNLDFSVEKKNVLPQQPIELTKQSSTIDLKSKENQSVMRQPMETVSVNVNNPVHVTPKRKIAALEERSVSARNNIELKSVNESQINHQDIDIANMNNPIDGTPKRKVIAHKGLSFPVNDEHVDEVVNEFCTNTTEVRINGDVFTFEWPSDEELLKRQNEARAKFKKALSVRNVRAPVVKKSVIAESDVKKDASLDEVDIKKASPKLYPLFSNLQGRKTESKAKGSAQKRSSLWDTSKGDEQMIIDAGQREIGSKVCKTCNMLYTIGHEEDERLHSGYHNTFLVNLRFPGWKNECIVGEFDDGRVIKILDTDKNFKLKKVQDVLYIANRDLGFPTAGFPSKPNVMFFLFISNDKRVGGCLVAEPIESACPVVIEEGTNPIVQNPGEKPIWKLGNWYASTTPVKAICGINRIWVAMEFRRQKMASRLVDCLRGSFIYGHVVDCREMAFTDPSLDGRSFAASYTETDNFLVYK